MEKRLQNERRQGEIVDDMGFVAIAEIAQVLIFRNIGFGAW